VADDTIRIEISTKDLAILIDVTPRWLQQMSTRGHISKSVRRGFYPYPDAIQDYIKFLREGGSTTTMADAKLRKALADAEISEFEAARAAGRLVDASLIKQQWSKLATELRTRLLAIPSKLAPILTGKKRTAEIESLIRGEVNEALREISETKVKEAV